MPRREKPSLPSNIKKARLASAQRGADRREAHKQALLADEAEIRGSLRLNKWLYPALQTGFFGGIAASVLTAAAGYREPALGVMAVALASEGALIARWTWCARNDRTTEDLDRIQETLHTVHHVFPDRGYFDRALEHDRRRINLRNDRDDRSKRETIIITRIKTKD